MNIRSALKESGLPALEAELLLAGILKTSRSALLAHDDAPVHVEDLYNFHQWIRRRKKNEPVAYILGEKEFYGRIFEVNADVLIPRPATEGLIDSVLSYLRENTSGSHETDTDISATVIPFEGRGKPTILADIGTGSGCIAITLALETAYDILATDISQRALNVAKKNAEYHGISSRIMLKIGNMLEAVSDIDVPFLLVTNPPYIPRKESVMTDVSDYEPHCALFAGDDGMDFLIPLLSRAKSNALCTGIAFECRNFQVEKLLNIL